MHNLLAIGILATLFGFLFNFNFKLTKCGYPSYSCSSHTLTNTSTCTLYFVDELISYYGHQLSLIAVAVKQKVIVSRARFILEGKSLM